MTLPLREVRHVIYSIANMSLWVMMCVFLCYVLESVILCIESQLLHLLRLFMLFVLYFFGDQLSS